MVTTPPIAVYTDHDELDITPGVALLEANGWSVRILGSREPADIMAQAGDTTALMVGYAPIDAAVIDALPNVRIMALLSMGVDNVDIAHATQRGVWVTNVPSAATREVAAHALALALSLVRRIDVYNAKVRAGDWSLLSAPLPKTLHETSCAVLGFGHVGREFARLATGMFSRVLVHDPFVTKLSAAEHKPGIELVSLDEAIAGGQVLSLHMPLTEQTHHLLDDARLRALPRGAIVINVSRGSLIDEAALERALEDGHISGAGLDVFANEPPGVDHKLLRHDNVLATPHIGFLSERTFTEYPLTQARNVLEFAEHGRPANPVNDLPIPGGG